MSDLLVAESAKDFFDFKKPITAVKHAVLSRYFDAFIAALSNNKYSRYDSIVYVDGFSGPGEYGDGDGDGEGNEKGEGSPLMILRKALIHTRLRERGPKVNLIFIELGEKRCEQLRGNLAKLWAKEAPGSRNENLVTYEVRQGAFVTVMNQILDSGSIRRETPLLVFADPFGFNGDLVPMSLMQKILRTSKKSEILINVMDGFANRFFNIDNRARAINELMGVENGEWKTAVHNAALPEDKKNGPKKRLSAFINFYISQLKSQTSQAHTLKFAMKGTNNRHKYHLVFLSQHTYGFIQMKKAMAKRSLRNGEFLFSEFDRNKGIEDDKAVDQLFFKAVLPLLLKEFGGLKEVSGKMMRDFIDLKTIYDFKFVHKIRKEFQISCKAGKFKDVLFDLSNVTANHSDDEAF